ncbi:MAG TPA: ABC transporter substrate-binding protein [Alkalispirochaeta sp.]|nr:ABC transporter substrate-binding protein [Alkalispirochaeta sp.]
MNVSVKWTTAAAACVLLVLSSCGGTEEVSRDEAEARREDNRTELMDRMVSRPGPPEWTLGETGGEWVTTINNDPKTFNEVNVTDAETGSIVGVLNDSLVDYDPYAREWKPNLADWEIEIDEAADSLRVIFTLRDDLYWTLPDQPLEDAVPVTASDVVYWYNEISGDAELQMSTNAQQFVTMPDGSSARIQAEQIDERRFAMIYPRIVANPLLSSNMSFGPRYLYEPAKEAGGAQAVLNLLSVDTEVTEIPSVGPYHIVEYTPGVRLVMQRNPHYWKSDAGGTGIPYVDRVIYRIVPDQNSEFLAFRNGTKDAYSARPEDLDELLNVEDPDYSVYNGGESLGASLISINQNPSNVDAVKHAWFIEPQFRQAISSMLNRERVVEQVYRGLASPAVHHFAEPNPMFNPDIRLEYTYNPERAVELLSEIGITRDEDGVMRDADGNAIEFSINMGAEGTIGIDIATILADELSEIGITMNVRPIDWQALVGRLTSTYDWEAVILSLGVNYWPTGGSNVWPSWGNLHMWHPLQEEPATEWEARIDYLYNEGRFTVDEAERREIYDEFQRILLEQLPVIYTVHPLAFLAVRDKWNNVFYDTLGGFDSERVFLDQ